MSDKPKVVTRFAPSPTGFLHIGGARTALFNWLFARHHGGTFLMRIEDTDRERSTDDAIEAIFEGLSWLGLDWDGDPVFQFSRQERHKEVVDQLLAAGHAYKCYCSPEELSEMREKARAEGRPMRYDGTWRDRDPADAPDGIRPVVRFKAPQNGSTLVKDHVLGNISFENDQLDDLILLRSDGTPTYMLSVVVDDHDMGVTHIIRGDDHLTNAARQSQIYAALDWTPPEFAHVPLIHGPDGAKLSKRHGALGAEAYRDMGYLPEAMRNYLVRLGWSHGNDEIFSTDQAIEWFDLESIGKSPARFDVTKLESLNAHYIRHADDARLVDLTIALMEKTGEWHSVDDAFKARLKCAMPGLKERAKTLHELAAGAAYLRVARPLDLTDKARKVLTDDARALLGQLADDLAADDKWTAESLEATTVRFLEGRDLKLGKVAQPLRAALTGGSVSPGIYDVLASLGREEALGRIRDQV
ncbi:MAG: glutamate--tRNA ligase [Parvibaculaceae bacterium]